MLEFLKNLEKQVQNWKNDLENVGNQNSIQYYFLRLHLVSIPMFPSNDVMTL